MLKASESLTKKQKGYSLIEVLVALFIFAIVISVVITVFVKINGSQQAVSNKQKAMEATIGVVESMAKTIRMSSLNLPSNFNYYTSGKSAIDQIILLDFGQNKCFQYKFTTDGNGVHRIAEQDGAQLKTDSTGGNVTGCADANGNAIATWNYLTSADISVDGQFMVYNHTYYKNVGGNLQTTKTGIEKVAILAKISDSSGNSMGNVETTVSLREGSLYQEDSPN